MPLPAASLTKSVDGISQLHGYHWAARRSKCCTRMECWGCGTKVAVWMLAWIKSMEGVAVPPWMAIDAEAPVDFENATR